MDEIGKPCQLQTVPDLPFVDALDPLGNIFCNGHIQNGKFLIHGTEQAVVFSAVELTYVDAVQGHTSLVGIVEAAQELDQGGLARSVTADQYRMLIFLYGKRNFLKVDASLYFTCTNEYLQMKHLGFVLERTFNF